MYLLCEVHGLSLEWRGMCQSGMRIKRTMQMAYALRTGSRRSASLSSWAKPKKTERPSKPEKPQKVSFSQNRVLVPDAERNRTWSGSIGGQRGVPNRIRPAEEGGGDRCASQRSCRLIQLEPGRQVQRDGPCARRSAAGSKQDLTVWLIHRSIREWMACGKCNRQRGRVRLTVKESCVQLAEERTGAVSAFRDQAEVRQAIME